MTGWKITIDQQVGTEGIRVRASQRYGPFALTDKHLIVAITTALSLAGLDFADTGQYQITAVPMQETTGR